MKLEIQNIILSVTKPEYGEASAYLASYINDLESQIANLTNEITHLKKEQKTLQSQLLLQEELITVLFTQLQAYQTKEATQQNEIEQLEENITKLTEQTKLNSQNSSKPPSSDGFKRIQKEIKSESPDTKRKVGGQKGHVGHGPKQVQKPDETINLSINECKCCGHVLTKEDIIKTEKRQEVRLPKEKHIVVEYCIHTSKCSKCGKKNRGKAPSHIRSCFQYGPCVMAWVNNLVHMQAIPYDRASKLSYQTYGIKISPGTIVNISKRINKSIQPSLARIKEHLLKSTVNHADETGIFINGKLVWTHSLSNSQYTILNQHQKRGGEGMSLNLKDYTGILIHDGLPAYNSFEQCTHGLCNAHHLRRLYREVEFRDQKWAQEMIDILVKGYHLSKKGPVPSDVQQEYIDKSFQLLQKALAALPPVKENKNKKGRPKKGPTRNLVEGLIRNHEKVWAFIMNPDIPFDNNQAERDLRMLKIVMKIKGCFRTEEGADIHLDYRSFAETARKNGLDPLELVKQMLVDEYFFDDFQYRIPL